MPEFTSAKLFSRVGQRIPLFVRFSTISGEKGPADTERDPRGFAVKYYTDEGNWDMVGNNTPVFFIRDPLKFGDFIGRHFQFLSCYWESETKRGAPTVVGRRKLPGCDSIMERLIARPIQEPCGLVVKNALKI